MGVGEAPGSCGAWRFFVLVTKSRTPCVREAPRSLWSQLRFSVLLFLLGAGSACTEPPLGSLPFFFSGTVSSLLLLRVLLPFSLFNFSGQWHEGTQPSGPLLCPPAVKPTAVTAHGTTEFKERGRDTASASCCVCGCHVHSRRHTRGTTSPSAVTCLSLWSL